MEVYIGIWIICAVLAFGIASAKGRSELLWAALGFIFGPLAVLILLVSPKTGEKSTQEALRDGELSICPYCKEPIKANAIKCKHCQSDLSKTDQGLAAGRAAHEQLQTAIYEGDADAVKAILSSGIKLADNPLPMSHLEYAELHGNGEIVELISEASS